ncbi:MAG TPA: hypothetical protein DCE23_02495 [Firmicutes bacterium]|nr:hypothetical protein [Bacillota bacterium]
MENSPEKLLQIFNILLVVMLFVLFVLIMVLVIIKVKDIKKQQPKKNEKGKKNNKTISVEDYSKESVYDFMEFDAIEDNMIVRKEGKRCVMVIKCNGSNFDLASEDEKLAIESGFLQFLNSLKFPIQIYIQTRKFNIENSIVEYKEKLNKLERENEKARTEYEITRRNPNSTDKQIKAAYIELKKTNNIYEYTKDVIKNTERMSMNKNVLKKEHYIAITYSPLEDLTSEEKYDKEELKDKAFAELYTRAQSLIRVLNACDVNGKILNSTELAELLYVAYNREQYEIYGIDKVLNSKYDQLYVTTPDIMDKKIKRLDKEIEERAGKKANELVDRVKSEKEQKIKDREDNMDDIVKEMTRIILNQNEQIIGKDVLERATELLEEEEGGAKNEKEERTKKKTTRRATSK